MITKLLEVRDSGTFIPVMAVQAIPECDGQEYLLRRSGYGLARYLVIVVRLDCNGGKHQASADPYGWGNRTLNVAHNYIEGNFADLQDGDVIDVEFILKETATKKLSERLT